jgi:hypothetical protein
MESKKFCLSDVLSFITGKLMSPKDMSGISEIFKFMTKNVIFLNQSKGLIRECKLEILTQHPLLKKINTSNLTTENYQEWLTEQIEKYGEYLSIRQLKTNLHSFEDPLEDPIEELKRMLNEHDVIFVQVGRKKTNEVNPLLN